MNLRIRRNNGRRWAAALAFACLCSEATAAYPERPIRVIVPIALGSVTDVIMRKAAQPLAERLGQAVVIDNRPGASGIIGAEACAKAPPDGYTICAIYHATTSFNPIFFDRLPYDPDKDFSPITRLFFLVEGIAVSSATGAKSFDDMRSFARGHPGKVSFGTLGDQSVQELMIGWLNQLWGTRIVGVPYKGGGPIATAIGANEIQMGQMGLGNFIAMKEAGKLDILTVNSDARSPLLPNVPTMKELALEGFDSKSWWGIAAPRGVPADAVARLHSAFKEVFESPEFISFLQAQYVDSALTTPEGFKAFLTSDRDKARKLIGLYKAKR